jgi:hypothetical protein
MKIKNMKVVMLSMVILFYGNVCFAQSAKDAVRALQKLQARVESGISYRDYAPALGDALFEVKLFLRSPEAKTKPELAAAVSKAMEYYQTAGEMWMSSIKAPALGVQISWEKAGQELEKAIGLLSH